MVAVWKSSVRLESLTSVNFHPLLNGIFRNDDISVKFWFIDLALSLCSRYWASAVMEPDAINAMLSSKFWKLDMGTIMFKAKRGEAWRRENKRVRMNEEERREKGECCGNYLNDCVTGVRVKLKV